MVKKVELAMCRLAQKSTAAMGMRSREDGKNSSIPRAIAGMDRFDYVTAMGIADYYQLAIAALKLP